MLRHRDRGEPRLRARRADRRDRAGRHPADPRGAAPPLSARRRLFVLHGERTQTRAQVASLFAALPPDEVLVVGPDHTPPSRVGGLLGRSFAACAIELHDGLDPDLLGQCHGLVCGGGALVVALPPRPPPQPGLAAYPYTVADVTTHLYGRVERVLAAAANPAEPLTAPAFARRGTAEQARVVDDLAEIFRRGGRAVLTADRGRGKSAALGLALRDVRGPVVVTAASFDAVGEVLAFAPASAGAAYVTPAELARGSAEYAAVIVDEAAQLPVDLLRALTTKVATNALVFATTTHGYEGTGQGFILRFVEWLERVDPTTRRLQLHEPIRWAAADPVERAVFDALLLDAEPAEPPAALNLGHRHVCRNELAGDERLLREIFGLLVQAHYRTTPRDLHRLLDAPNLDVHASFAGDTVVAATLVAREGGLPGDLCRALGVGDRRVIGHALPETFASHLGYPDAAGFTMARSVRIAVHPHVRRFGIASALVEHVHAFYDVDLFGTIFGATADLLRFRQSTGYAAIRLSSSRSERSGLWSVAMVRPVSPRARALVDALRADFARDLPVQHELLRADTGEPIEAELLTELIRDLPPPAPLTGARRDEIVATYAFGPRTLESAAVAVEAFIRDVGLDQLDPALRVLIERRVLQRTSWARAAADAELPSVSAAMRALRRAVRTLASARGLGHPDTNSN